MQGEPQVRRERVMDEWVIQTKNRRGQWQDAVKYTSMRQGYEQCNKMRASAAAPVRLMHRYVMQEIILE